MRKKIAAVLVLTFLFCALCSCSLFGKEEKETSQDKIYRYGFTLDGKEFSYEFIMKEDVPKSLKLYEGGKDLYEYALSDWSNGAKAEVLCGEGSETVYADILLQEDSFTFRYNEVPNETASDRIFSGYDYYAGEYATHGYDFVEKTYVLRENGTALCGETAGKFYPWSGNTVLVECGAVKEIVTITNRILGECTVGAQYPESKMCYMRGTFTGDPFIGQSARYNGDAEKSLFVKGEQAALVDLEADTRLSSGRIDFGTFIEKEDDYLFSVTNRTYTLAEKTFMESGYSVYTSVEDANRKLYVYNDYRLIKNGEETESNFLIDDFWSDDKYYYTLYRFDVERGYTVVNLFDKNIREVMLFQSMADAAFVGLDNARVYVGDAPESADTYGILSDGFTTFTVSNTELILIGEETGTMYLRMPEGQYTIPAYYVYYYETDENGNIKIAGNASSAVRFSLRDDGTCTVAIP